MRYLALSWIAVAALACSGEVSTPTCDTGRVACGEICVDTAGDARHCGACGHDCLGGACQAGVCQVATIASGQAAPYGVAVDAKAIYFTDITAGSVMTCPIAGCGTAPALFASGLDNPHDVKSDGENVYFTTSDSVLSCPVSGCGAKPTVIAGGQADPEVVVIDGSRVYWAAHVGGAVLSCPLSGCKGAPTVIAANESGALAIAVDTNNVYWTDGVTPGGTVRSCPLSGCGPTGPTTLAGDLDIPQDIVTNGQRVYWTNWSGYSVMSCPVTGCNGSPDIMLTASAFFDGIALDASNVYFTNGMDDGSVMSCPLAGCPPEGPKVLGAHQSAAGKVAVDDQAVYWTASKAGTVLRLAK